MNFKKYNGQLKIESVPYEEEEEYRNQEHDLDRDVNSQNNQKGNRLTFLDGEPKYYESSSLRISDQLLDIKTMSASYKSTSNSKS